MIHERRHSEAVDNLLSAIQPKQIRVGIIVIKIIGLIVSQILANVFNDQRPFANLPSGIAPKRMYARLANDKCHRVLGRKYMLAEIL